MSSGWKICEPARARAAAEKILPTLVAPRAASSSSSGEPAPDTFAELAPFATEIVRRLTLFASTTWGPVWASNDVECEGIATAVLDVARHELPDLEQLGPWEKLCIVVSMYAGPRIVATKFGKPATSSSSSTAPKEEPRAADVISVA